MSGSIHTRPVAGVDVLFLYAYAGSNTDAVARAVAELAVGISDRGIPATVLSHWREEAHSFGRLSRMRFQARYLVGAARRLFTSTPPLTVVTVDVPLGIRVLAEIWRRLEPFRHHIAWTMDLYGLQPKCRPGVKRSSDAARRFIEVTSLRATELIVTLGDCMAGLIWSSTGRTSTVIPLWQDDNWLTPEAAEPALSGEDVDFIYSGHAGAAHPLVPLADAIRTARNSGARVRLSIVGHGTSVAEVHEWLKANPGAGVAVSKPLTREAALKRLRAADVHVAILSAEFAGTCVPSKTYAAMALGKPVLFLGPASSQAAVDVAQSCGGLVVEPLEGADASAAIEKLQDANVRAQMGMRARAFYVSQRTLDAALDRWVPLIKGTQEPANAG